MRLLIAASYYYCNDTRAVEPQFYYLFKVPESMGHEVDFFDFHTAAKISPEHARRLFLALLASGRYDGAFIATHRDEFDEGTLKEAQRHCPVIAWNSDDEYRWQGYSSKQAGWYSWMVTNSAEVYARESAAHRNLLHAQWACTGFWDGRNTKKDVDFSFAGQFHGRRKEQCVFLSRRAEMAVFGMGAKFLDLPFPANLPEDLKSPAWQTTLHFESINQLWNRSRISYTPLDSSDGSTMQIKSRVFDMGLSGTLMLAPAAAPVNRYYEPGKEYVAFETLEDCVEKARFYIAHERERRRIAGAYAERTLSEHLWRHRIEHVLRQAGLAA
ncbi:MAG TPA: glycosyltransferase [Tepidisphaeraceae bacterium]|nr:glycosyltransferase [Tepidisphaeraceae bacterium]